MSGGGGGKAIGFLIENADSNHGTLMVNSTPIVIRSLTGVFPHNFRDLTLVSGTIGDYAALVVGKDSPIGSMAELIAAFDADPGATAIGGGSVPGGMDHLVAAMVMEAAGKDALAVKYIPYDAGGKAMAALLSGEIAALSTGFSEAVDLANAGEVKIIGVTSDARVDAAPDAMTMKEQGIDTTFVNWRGFFAAPGLPDDRLALYQDVIAKMYGTPEWEEVRARNGWVNIHNSGDDFKAFLEDQENGHRRPDEEARIPLTDPAAERSFRSAASLHEEATTWHWIAGSRLLFWASAWPMDTLPGLPWMAALPRS